MTQLEENTSLSSEFLSVEVAAAGAELQSLRDAAGRDFLWNGDPAWWGGRAPLLFPIVGKVKDDHILVDGIRYPMRQHGLARISRFALVEAGEARCRYRLEASDATRSIYPFDFRLDVDYALERRTLRIVATVSNLGARTMPVSFGFHPAFRWPLPDGGPRESHFLKFDADEPAPFRRLRQGLLAPDPQPTPVRGDLLPLSDGLFTEDALIFDHPVSRGVTYASTKGPSIRVDYPDMPQLGVWSKPGAGFVCIEPWRGHAAPEGFDGELRDKQGGLDLPTGASAAFSMSVSVLD